MSARLIRDRSREDGAGVESLIARAARCFAQGEMDEATRLLARAAQALLVSGFRRRAESVLRSLLDRGVAHATLDGELTAACFRSGLGDLGVAFAVRAARTLRMSGDAAASDRTLREAERRVLALGSTALATLADARIEFGALDAAARLLVVAAERARREADAVRAVALCLRASRCGALVRGLHRAWGLALLAGGDPDGARGHLERWCEEEPESVDALLWTLEASWRRRPVTEIGPLVERLVERLDAKGGRGDGTDLRERVRSHLRGRGTAAGELALAPFWEAEDFPWALRARESRRANGAPRRRVLLLEDATPSARSLARILERWSLEVVTADEGEVPTPAVGVASLFDVALIALPDDMDAAAARVERLRSRPDLAQASVLGIVAVGGSSLDYARLRELGVMGVVDRRATPEHVAFRIGQVAALGRDAARRYVRAPVDFTVELEVEGEGRATDERAENLSCGGIRLRSRRALEPNTDVVLRFRPSEHFHEPIRVEGRVIHCHAHPEEPGAHGLGIFFSSLEPSQRELLEDEVVRLLERGDAGEAPAELAVGRS